MSSPAERIRALREKAAHPSTPPAEAQLCTERANEIAKKYGVTEQSKITVNSAYGRGLRDFVVYNWATGRYEHANIADLFRPKGSSYFTFGWTEEPDWVRNKWEEAYQRYQHGDHPWAPKTEEPPPPPETMPTYKGKM